MKLQLRSPMSSSARKSTTISHRNYHGNQESRITTEQLIRPSVIFQCFLSTTFAGKKRTATRLWPLAVRGYQKAYSYFLNRQANLSGDSRQTRGSMKSLETHMIKPAGELCS